MKGMKRISELLLETGAYKDLDAPTILTSGVLGIYYVNTEKLLQDGNSWANYGDSSAEMISYANGLLARKAVFKEVIDIIAEEAASKISNNKDKYENIVISGGQRRDWLFSGPVAHVLGLSHISLYKQTGEVGRFEVLSREGLLSGECNIRGWYVVHVVDLITEGSSVYSLNNGEPRGWVPTLRRCGAVIDSLYSVVTRCQGGEERLLEQGVKVNSFVSIDADFLRQYSKYPDRALDYAKDPSEWSKNYIRENGAGEFIDFFDPDGGRLDRALKFLVRYKRVLSSVGKLEELEKQIRSRYGSPPLL